jgi:hypothetical protein
VLLTVATTLVENQSNYDATSNVASMHARYYGYMVMISGRNEMGTYSLDQNHMLPQQTEILKHDAQKCYGPEYKHKNMNVKFIKYPFKDKTTLIIMLCRLRKCQCFGKRAVSTFRAVCLQVKSILSFGILQFRNI